MHRSAVTMHCSAVTMHHSAVTMHRSAVTMQQFYKKGIMAPMECTPMAYSTNAKDMVL